MIDQLFPFLCFHLLSLLQNWLKSIVVLRETLTFCFILSIIRVDDMLIAKRRSFSLLFVHPESQKSNNSSDCQAQHNSQHNHNNLCFALSTGFASVAIVIVIIITTTTTTARGFGLKGMNKENILST
eukprot:TRINITY_DN2067_c0_g1_i1.p1 TRINITY_DN2067_c0_g1~~TRINITY_DN2067_c0_g1_i1.p1  ORF type:complete len:127 (-),score=30.46 TRINITY_DN2067_c0_g1_i1:228-608(-)